MVILCIHVHYTFSLCVCELFFTDLLNFGWKFESAHKELGSYEVRTLNC